MSKAKQLLSDKKSLEWQTKVANLLQEPQNECDEIKVHLKKSHLDPTAGLHNVSGNPFLHLAMGIVLFTVDKQESTEISPECQAYKDELVWIIKMMQIVHIACFIKMLLSAILNLYHFENKFYKWI